MIMTRKCSSPCYSHILHILPKPLTNPQGKTYLSALITRVYPEAWEPQYYIKQNTAYEHVVKCHWACQNPAVSNSIFCILIDNIQNPERPFLSLGNRGELICECQAPDCTFINLLIQWQSNVGPDVQCWSPARPLQSPCFLKGHRHFRLLQQPESFRIPIWPSSTCPVHAQSRLPLPPKCTASQSIPPHAVAWSKSAFNLNAWTPRTSPAQFHGLMRSVFHATPRGIEMLNLFLLLPVGDSLGLPLSSESNPYSFQDPVWSSLVFLYSLFHEY